MSRILRAGVTTIAAALVAHASAACAQQPARQPAQPLPRSAPRPVTTPGTPASVSSDTNATGLIPPGLGTLRQDEVSLRLQLPDVLVKLIPMDEAVIRTLSADSYRALRELVESRRPAITRLAQQRGLQRTDVWYVSFYGLAPDARFSPLELTITSAGRDFRPVEAIALSAGFGEQRLQPRETQSALYLFEEGIELNQPITVALGTERNSSWATILRDVERERALIRSRAAQSRPGTTP